MLRIAFLMLLTSSYSYAADRPFNWDRYHDRRDACTELDQMRWYCVQNNVPCDEVAMRQLQRDCSAFSSDRRRP